MKIEEWIKGVGHEDSLVRNASLMLVTDLELAEAIKSEVMSEALAALKKWGWREAYDYPHVITKLPISGESVSWVIDQVKVGDFREDSMIRGHLMNWIAESASILSDEVKMSLQDEHDRFAESIGGDKKDLWITDVMEADAEVCERQIKFLVTSMAKGDEYPHAELDTMKNWCQRWVKVAPRDVLDQRVKEWLYPDEVWDWSCDAPWFVCVAIELAGLLKLKCHSNRLIEQFEMDSDAGSTLTKTAMARMMDDSLLADLASQFMEMRDVAQLYISGSISNAGEVRDVAPLLPLLKAGPEKFEYETIQPNLARAVAVFGEDSLMPALEEYVQRDCDDPEIGMVVEVLFARYVLHGGDPVRLAAHRKYLDAQRARQAEPSPLQSMLLQMADKREISLNDPDQQKEARSDWTPQAVEQRIAPPKVGRNEPCPCGSGKKYKKCCSD